MVVSKRGRLPKKLPAELILRASKRAPLVYAFESSMEQILKEGSKSIAKNRVSCQNFLIKLRSTNLGPSQRLVLNRMLKLTRRKTFGPEELTAIVSGTCLFKYNFKR
jgi:hypothetical protein